MTTRNKNAKAKKAPSVGRISRKPPARTGPDRSGETSRKAAAAKDPPKVVAPAMPLLTPGETALDDSIAASVKTAYDVLAQSIEQGRKSAESFRHGGYNFRDVPADVSHLAANMLRLARQLSETAFEVCEALLAQMKQGGGPPPPGATPVPPFRSPAEASAAKPSGKPEPSKQPGPPEMRLGVTFVGAAKAVSHSDSLARPSVPVRADQISAAPLAPRGKAAPLAKVSFAADLQHGGLTATVTVPAGQPGGVYSGLVFAEGQDAPLGMLVVELPQAAPRRRG